MSKRSPAKYGSFDEWWLSAGSVYEQAVIARGGTPWPSDPAKRAAITARLGLPEDIAPMDLRRQLWDHSRSGHTCSSKQRMTTESCVTKV